MVQYYYSKYQSLEAYGNEPGTMWRDTGSYRMYFAGAYKTIIWDGSKWVGGTQWASGVNVFAGNVAYTVDGSGVNKYVALHGNQSQYNVDVDRYYTNPQGAVPVVTYRQGSLVSSNIVAENGTYPNNGRHTDGFWYVRGAALPTNTAPTTPGAFTSPTSGMVLKGGQSVILSWGASSDNDGNLSNYEVEESLNGGAFALISSPVTTSVTRTITSNKSITSVVWRLRAKDSAGAYSAYRTSPTYTINHNIAPVVTLEKPSNNQTLYENDLYIIDGTVLETNIGDTITVRYQIGAGTERAIKAYLSTGTLEAFGKQLSFKGGNLYDGETLIASNLVDGIAHTLRVWATDDKGNTSTVVERTFYVVPNRAPLLSVNPPVISGLINSDKFKINGTFDDSDGNNTIVSYRLNGASSIQIAEGVSGPFEFEVTFGQLNIGTNEIIIEAVDSYGAKVSKTVKLNKSTVENPLLRSTVRYKINPPTGSSRGVLLWIQRDGNLDIDVAISMTMQGEAELFVPLTVSNSAPLDQSSTIVEDEFYHEADSAKDNIILQIDMERESIEVSDKIYLISGVLD